MPTSSNPAPPADSSPPPGSTPPASPAVATGLSTADVVAQALAAVVAQFPPDSTVLFDLKLGVTTDTYVAVTIVLNPRPKIPADDIQVIIDALVDEFQRAGLAQFPSVSFASSASMAAPATTEDGTSDESEPAPASGSEQ